MTRDWLPLNTVFISFGSITYNTSSSHMNSIEFSISNPFLPVSICNFGRPTHYYLSSHKVVHIYFEFWCLRSPQTCLLNQTMDCGDPDSVRYYWLLVWSRFEAICGKGFSVDDNSLSLSYYISWIMERQSLHDRLLLINDLAAELNPWWKESIYFVWKLVLGI